MLEPNPILDRGAALFGQDPDGARLDVVGNPRIQPRLMLSEKVLQQPRIGWIILGATDGQRGPIPGQSFRIDRIQNDKLVIHQCVNQRTFGLLDRNPDRPASELLAQLAHPGVNRLRLLFQLELVEYRFIHRFQAHRVCSIRPVQSNVSCQFHHVVFTSPLHGL